MAAVEAWRDGGVLFLLLDRPEARNALDGEMLEALEGHLEEAAGDPGVRGLVLGGKGEAFCAGVDLTLLERGGEADPRARRRLSERLSRMVGTLEALEKPVVVAVNGPATGLGLTLVLAADLRVAAPEARLLFREGRIGLLPAHGGLARLVRYLGLGRARDLLLGGEELDAEQAQAWGLFTEVVPRERLLEAARARLERALERAPLSYALVKRLLLLSGQVDLESALFLEGLGQEILRGSEDHREGLAALRERRPPRFRGQ